MDRVRHALIMAAGRGRRLMPFTQVMPKPMVPYGNSTLIANGISRLRPHIDYIHVTVGYKGAMLAQHLIEHGVTSIFNTEGRSNSWWIHNTLMSRVDEPVFVLTCDNVTDLDFTELAADYFRLGSPACLLVAVEPVPGLEGDYILRDGSRVLEVNRKKTADIYCSGIQVLNPARVSGLTGAGGNFYDIWRELIAQGEVVVSSVRPGKWFTVDTLEDLQKSGE